VAVDAAGNLVIADTGNDRVRVVAARTGTFYGQAMTAGDIYTVAGNGVFGSSGSGGLAANAELARPPVAGYSGVAADSGNYAVVQSNRAWFICQTAGVYFGRAMTAGDIYHVAGGGKKGYSGDGGPGTSAELDYPEGVAFDAAGNLVIADTDNNRVRVVAARTGTFYGRAMTAGDIYTVAGDGTKGYSGDGGPATSAELNEPFGVAFDAAGNLVIADNNRVRVVAASTGTFYGRAMTAGDIYTVAGDGKSGYSGDGGPATSAGMSPTGVAVDGSGNLVIADNGNGRVRVVAASTGTFYGQAMTAGDIYTVAGDGNKVYSGDGGPATSAGISPTGVAVDPAGNLVIADAANNRVRLVAASTGTFYGQAMTAGDIYTVAGDGTSGYSGDGGPATSARLDTPFGVAVDGSGNLLIADSQNALVRLVTG
jgi:trimeric autotransporter adhesin